MKASAREDSVSSAVYAVAGALLIVGLLAAFAWLPRLIHARESEQVGKDAPVVKVPLVLNAEQLTEPPGLAPAAIGTDELRGKRSSSISGRRGAGRARRRRQS